MDFLLHNANEKAPRRRMALTRPPRAKGECGCLRAAGDLLRGRVRLPVHGEHGQLAARLVSLARVKSLPER